MSYSQWHKPSLVSFASFPDVSLDRTSYNDRQEAKGQENTE